MRTDLPPGLLMATALGMSRAMDMWLMAQALPPLISALVGMLRRALQPEKRVARLPLLADLASLNSTHDGGTTGHDPAGVVG